MPSFFNTPLTLSNGNNLTFNSITGNNVIFTSNDNTIKACSKRIVCLFVFFWVLFYNNLII